MNDPWIIEILDELIDRDLQVMDAADEIERLRAQRDEANARARRLERMLKAELGTAR